MLHKPSLDEKKAQSVVDEIKAAGGDAIAVGGDVGADDFPAKILDATIKYAPYFSFYGPFSLFARRYGKLNHIVNNGAFTWFLRPYRSWLLTGLLKLASLLTVCCTQCRTMHGSSS